MLSERNLKPFFKILKTDGDRFLVPRWLEFWKWYEKEKHAKALT